MDGELVAFLDRVLFTVWLLVLIPGALAGLLIILLGGFCEKRRD